jgi:hypothetical protein
VGPGRYRGRRRDAVTNAYPKSYAITNSFTCCLRAIGDAITNANSHGNSDTYRVSYSDVNGDGHSYGYVHAYTDCDSYSHTDANSNRYSCGNSNTYTYFYA